MVSDIMQEVLDLLSNNWDDSNTSSLTPEFLKITDATSKRYDFNTNKYLVLAHVPSLRPEKNGIGQTSKRIRDEVKIDLRVFGKDLESNYTEMYAEIVRILDDNIVDPFSGYQELNIDDVEHPDLSDKNKGLFRKMIPVKLINYNVSR